MTEVDLLEAENTSIRIEVILTKASWLSQSKVWRSAGLDACSSWGDDEWGDQDTLGVRSMKAQPGNLED